MLVALATFCPDCRSDQSGFSTEAEAYCAHVLHELAAADMLYK